MPRKIMKMDNEIWKDVIGYEGLYQVSNYGRVKSFWFWNNSDNQRHYREKIIKPKISPKDKCSRIELWRGGKHETLLVYRLELCAFTNKPYDYEMTVNHKDGNRLNNNLDNLEWLSRADNIRYGFDNGQYPTCKRIIVKDKLTGQKTMLRSMSAASKFMNRYHGYISDKERKGEHEDGLYSWELVS